MTAQGGAPTLVIMAAGAARRYGSLKQLAPMGPNGEALLEYSAYDARRSGFGGVVLIVQPETEALFRDGAGGRIAHQMPVRYVHQTLAHQTLGDVPENDVPENNARRKPWGTAQAVLTAEGINGPFAVINADDFYGRESYATLSAFLETSSSSERVFALPGFELAATLSDSGPVTRALCQVDADGWLEDIVECHGLVKDGPQIGVVSMNIWAFTPAIFPELQRLFTTFVAESPGADEEFLLPDAIRTLIHKGRARVRVLQGAGEWCGVTFREDRSAVTQRLAELVDRGEYPRDLWGSPP